MIKSRSKQAGIALLSAAMMTTILVSVVAALAYRHFLDMHRYGRALDADRAVMLAMSAESLALELLDQDEFDEIDDLNEDWARVLPPLPVEGGLLSPELKDLQARFNINSLADVDKAGWERYSRGQRRGWSRIRMLDDLYVAVGLPQEHAKYARIIDWLDEDNNLTAAGSSEDSDYLLEDPPMRAANRLMVDIYELDLVRNFPMEDLYELLVERNDPENPREQLVTVLPIAENEININTASRLIIASLHFDITLAIADSIIEKRPYENTNEFFEELEAQLGPKKKVFEDYFLNNSDGSTLVVRTHYFELTTIIQIGDSTAKMTSLIYRPDGYYKASKINPVVYQRSFGLLPDLAQLPPDALEEAGEAGNTELEALMNSRQGVQ